MGVPKFVLGRHLLAAATPGGGLGANLILSPNGPYTSANWSGAAVTETTGQTDPLSGTSASLLTDTVTNTQHYIGLAAPVSFLASQKYLLTYYVKPGTWAGIVSFATGLGGTAYLEFDCTAHTAADGGGNAVSSPQATLVGNGFYKVTGTFVNVTGGNASAFLGFSHQAGPYAGSNQNFTLWGVAIQTSS